MKRTLITIAVFISALVVSGGSDPAMGAVLDKSCSASGFTGTFRISSSATHQLSYYYKITKGSNPGGNHANINLTFSTEPVLTYQSPDSMLQDGVFHYLNTGGLATNPVGVQFIFDLSGASDPRCTMWVSGVV